MTPAQIRGAKALLGWDNDALAQKAGLSRNTIQAMSVGDGDKGTVRTYRLVRETLEAAGIKFFEDKDSGTIGVLLRPVRGGQE